MRIEQKTAGSVTILKCAGEVGHDDARVLGEQTGAAVQAGCRQLVFSLGDLEHFNSMVLAGLVSASRRVNAVAGELVVAAAPSPLQKTIEILGLDQTLKVFPDDRAALAYFREEGGDVTGCCARLEPPRPSDSAGAWPDEHPRPRP